MEMSSRFKKLSCHFPDESSVRIVDLPNDSPAARDVLSLCESKFLVPPTSNFSWHETSVIGLENSHLMSEFMFKLGEMYMQRCSIEELNVDFAFRCINGNKIDGITRRGLSVRPNKCSQHSLGYQNLGLVLHKNIDTCLHLSQMHGKKPPMYILICKILLGRQMHVKPLLGQPFSPFPTVGFHCHVSSIKSRADAPCNERAISDAVYLYDFNQDGRLLDRPRQVLPYAVVKVTEKCLQQFKVSALIKNGTTFYHHNLKPEVRRKKRPSSSKKDHHSVTKRQRRASGKKSNNSDSPDPQVSPIRLKFSVNPVTKVIQAKLKKKASAEKVMKKTAKSKCKENPKSKDFPTTNENNDSSCVIPEESDEMQVTLTNDSDNAKVIERNEFEQILCGMKQPEDITLDLEKCAFMDDWKMDASFDGDEVPVQQVVQKSYFPKTEFNSLSDRFTSYCILSEQKFEPLPTSYLPDCVQNDSLFTHPDVLANLSKLGIEVKIDNHRVTKTYDYDEFWDNEVISKITVSKLVNSFTDESYLQSIQQDDNCETRETLPVAKSKLQESRFDSGESISIEANITSDKDSVPDIPMSPDKHVEKMESPLDGNNNKSAENCDDTMEDDKRFITLDETGFSESMDFRFDEDTESCCSGQTEKVTSQEEDENSSIFSVETVEIDNNMNKETIPYCSTKAETSSQKSREITIPLSDNSVVCPADKEEGLNDDSHLQKLSSGHIEISSEVSLNDRTLPYGNISTVETFNDSKDETKPYGCLLDCDNSDEVEKPGILTQDVNCGRAHVEKLRKPGKEDDRSANGDSEQLRSVHVGNDKQQVKSNDKRKEIFNHHQAEQDSDEKIVRSENDKLANSELNDNLIENQCKSNELINSHITDAVKSEIKVNGDELMLTPSTAVQETLEDILNVVECSGNGEFDEKVDHVTIRVDAGDMCEIEINPTETFLGKESNFNMSDLLNNSPQGSDSILREVANVNEDTVDESHDVRIKELMAVQREDLKVIPIQTFLDKKDDSDIGSIDSKNLESQKPKEDRSMDVSTDHHNSSKRPELDSFISKWVETGQYAENDMEATSAMEIDLESASSETEEKNVCSETSSNDDSTSVKSSKPLDSEMLASNDIMDGSPMDIVDSGANSPNPTCLQSSNSINPSWGAQFLPQLSTFPCGGPPIMDPFLVMQMMCNALLAGYPPPPQMPQFNAPSLASGEVLESHPKSPGSNSPISSADSNAQKGNDWIDVADSNSVEKLIKAAESDITSLNAHITAEKNPAKCAKLLSILKKLEETIAVARKQKQDLSSTDSKDVAEIVNRTSKLGSKKRDRKKMKFQGRTLLKGNVTPRKIPLEPVDGFEKLFVDRRLNFDGKKVAEDISQSPGRAFLWSDTICKNDKLHPVEISDQTSCKLRLLKVEVLGDDPRIGHGMYADIRQGAKPYHYDPLASSGDSDLATPQVKHDDSVDLIQIKAFKEVEVSWHCLDREKVHLKMAKSLENSKELLKRLHSREGSAESETNF